MKVIVIGDIILDTNHYCITTRNAPEANIPVYNTLSTKHILGGAANVAKNLKNLNCEVELISVIGDDYPGSIITRLLVKSDIKQNIFIDNSRETTQKTRLFCNSTLINRYDTEDIHDISEELNNTIIQYVKSLTGIDAIVFSDYNKGVLTKDICGKIIAYSRENHIFTFVDPKPNGFIKYKNCFCLKLNLLEVETISNKNSKYDIIKYLKQYIACDNIVLTCGKDGLYVNSVQNHIVSNSPVNVTDVTGCGDIVLVVITYMYLHTQNIILASKIANYVARTGVVYIGNHQISQSNIDNFVDTIVMDYEHDKLARISNDNKNIVFTNGCFDIIHSAHIKLLQFAKTLGDILIVGINSNNSIKLLKGDKRPINDIGERCDLLNNLGIIDYIIIFDDNTPLKILSVIKPNIIVKGGDYTENTIVGKEYANEIVIYDYIDGISSTNTIRKVTNCV